MTRGKLLLLGRRIGRRFAQGCLPGTTRGSDFDRAERFPLSLLHGFSLRRAAHAFLGGQTGLVGGLHLQGDFVGTHGLRLGGPQCADYGLTPCTHKGFYSRPFFSDATRRFLGFALCPRLGLKPRSFLGLPTGFFLGFAFRPCLSFKPRSFLSLPTGLFLRFTLRQRLGLKPCSFLGLTTGFLLGLTTGFLLGLTTGFLLGFALSPRLSLKSRPFLSLPTGLFLGFPLCPRLSLTDPAR